jgi:toxin ParE1/3/4
MLEKLKQKASLPARFPERGRFVPELGRFAIRTYRELHVRPYRVLYRIAGRRVIVLGVFDGRRDLSELILRRLLRG